MNVLLATAATGMIAGAGSPSISDEGRRLDAEITSIAKGFQCLESVGMGAAWSEIERVIDECRSEDWDGYGASPLSFTSFNVAARFLFALPMGTKAPSVGVDPDGELTFEWYRTPKRLLSVSISPDGMLNYAATLGSTTQYGSEPFLGHPPAAILDLIRRVG